jgi:hypothetical protein
MAIRVIEGVPGAGKTFFAVDHLVKTYFVQDGEYYIQKPIITDDGKKQKLIISTNLQNLKLPHVSLDDEIRSAGGPHVFFSHAYQVKIEKEDERRVYFIDEAQLIFRRKVVGDWSEVWHYFELHRHFGHDIYLITQNEKKINIELTSLVEYKIVAKARVRSLTGEFPYQIVSDGDILKRFGLRPNKKIFDLYQSRRKAESEKVKNPVVRTIAMICILSGSIIGGATWYVNHVWGVGFRDPDIPIETKETVTETPEKKVTRKVIVPDTLTVSDDIIVLPVSVSSIYHGGKSVRYLFIKGEYFEEKLFPYTIKKIGGKIYAELPKSLHGMLYGEDKIEELSNKKLAPNA